MTAETMFSCPACKSTHGVRDEVDVGVGTIYGPYRCEDCGWNEKGACPICGKEGCHCNYEDGLL